MIATIAVIVIALIGLYVLYKIVKLWIADFRHTLPTPKISEEELKQARARSGFIAATSPRRKI